jgi:hypothetical protein
MGVDGVGNSKKKTECQGYPEDHLELQLFLEHFRLFSMQDGLRLDNASRIWSECKVLEKAGKAGSQPGSGENGGEFQLGSDDERTELGLFVVPEQLEKSLENSLFQEGDVGGRHPRHLNLAAGHLPVPAGGALFAEKLLHELPGPGLEVGAPQ